MASPSNVPSNVSPGQLATADQYNAITSFMANYGVAIYATDPASPNLGQVWYNSSEKLLKMSEYSLVLNKTFTAASGHNKIYALTSDGTYIYAGYNTSPGVVDQITPSTMTVNKTFTGASGHNKVYSLTHDGTYIYAGYFGADSFVDQIIPSSMILNKTFAPVNTSLGGIRSLAYDGTYIYAGTSASPGIIFQIDTSTMEQAKRFTARTGKNGVGRLAYDGTFLYALYFASPSNKSPGVVDQIYPNSMERTRTFFSPSSHVPGPAFSDPGALLCAGGFVYIGYQGSPGILDQVSKAGATRIISSV